MLDINKIKENPEKIAAALAKKGCDTDLSPVIAWDNERKAAISGVEQLKARRNKVSAEIPKLKKEGKPVEHIFKEMREIGDEIADRDADINALVERITDFLSRLPNLPDDDLLPGEKENNQVVRIVGEKPEFSFPVKNHVDLCTSLGLIDYERGVKLGGNGFWIYRGLGAQLEWALLNYFVEEHLKDGYEFILPPHQLNYDCGYGAGQFPKFSDEVYWLDLDEDRHRNRFMLPTAETALVNMYAGEIIDESKLPMKFFAYTPCYRKEAGSYRAEERGMIRGHQFNKVEMVQYTTPETSRAAFEELVNIPNTVWKRSRSSSTRRRRWSKNWGCISGFPNLRRGIVPRLWQGLTTWSCGYRVWAYTRSAVPCPTPTTIRRAATTRVTAIPRRANPLTCTPSTAAALPPAGSSPQ